ncbi:hypothetical protein X943_000251 [Babesia divergens]|uniref:MMS19 nucleotide excision repair protein n=1 Tax=Babesia divergens TaxID=32595 RepID=A0AAD9GCN8_BABDI|nr:hypothetical protein X943_000251 [Babesia divergens]
MQDTVEKELASQVNSSLIEWIKQYCKNDSNSGFCEPRNHIIVAVVRGEERNFVNIVVDSYEKEDDLVGKRNISRLLYDVLSRTEDIFAPEDIVPLLTKCLPVTICAHFAISGFRSLLQRHVKLKGVSPENLEIIKGMYDILLSQNIASMAQQPRIDFLWISHFMVDAFRNTQAMPLENMVTRFCACVTGEKDPRNLLVLFELIVKLCDNELSEEEIKALAALYTTYYPIQFSPPKNDRIGIKPVDLKERLLKTFKACRKFGPYSMEVMIDCLYSGYGANDEHIEILRDTLRFFRECAPVYSEECFSEHLESFIEVIISELFVASATDTEEQGNSTIDGSMGMNIGPVSLELDCKDFHIVDANKLGELYYESWESVSKHLQIFGDILEVYMNMVDLEGKIESITNFIKLLREQFTVDNSKNSDANGHAGYLLDVLCGSERYHGLIIEHVIVPLCNEIISKFAELKRGELAETALCSQMSLMLPVLTSTLFAKIVSKCQNPVPTKFATSIIVAALCCIQLNENKMFSRGLKLLALAIASSKSSMLEHVLNHCLKDSQILSKTSSTRSCKDVGLYADAILAIMKCHFVHCGPLVNLVRAMAKDIVEAEDIEAEVLAYTTKEMDLSREVAEIIATTLEKTTDDELVSIICTMCCRCFLYVCDNPKSKIMETTYLLSLAITANRNKVSKLIKTQLPFNKMFDYYKGFWELEQNEDLSQSALKLATHILPNYMSMVLDCSAVSISEKFCQKGYAFLLPIILKDLNDDVINVVIEHAKNSSNMMELEAIAWMLQRWAAQISFNEICLTETGKSKPLSYYNVSTSGVTGVLSNGLMRAVDYIDRLASDGVPQMLLSYVIEVMEHEDMKEFCIETYLKNIPSSVLTSFVSHLFPFQPKKLALGLRYLGFDLKSMTNPRQNYSDIFMLDGTEICRLPPIWRIQYQFLSIHCQRKPCQDTNIAKHLIKLLCGMNDDLPTIVALQALVLSLEDSEIATDYADVAEVLVKEFIKRWANIGAANTLKKETFTTENADCDKVDDSSVYETWLRHEFLFQSLALLVRLMSYVELRKIPDRDCSYDFDYGSKLIQKKTVAPEEKCLFSLESGQWEQLTDVAVRAALGASLPVCRILSTLVVHCIMKCEPNTISAGNVKSVIKRMAGCLGDGDQRVRTVALTCRHMWFRR